MFRGPFPRGVSVAGKKVVTEEVLGQFKQGLTSLEAMPHSVHPTPRCNTPDQQQQQHDIGGLWWNSNQPQSQWTEECPEFLVGQSAKNISILSRSADEERPRFTWEDVQRLASQYIPSFP